MPFIQQEALMIDQFFLKYFCVMVLSLKGVAKEFKVEAMPTFVLWKEGKEVERFVGANKVELEKKIKQLSQSWKHVW